MPFQKANQKFIGYTRKGNQMKLVIYKVNGVYKVTPESNYNAYIQNARQIQTMHDFESANEIVEYYCKYFNANPTDFIIIDN